MLLATLVLCSSLDPSLCFIAQDAKGPYATEELCIARLIEMNESIKSTPLLKNFVLEKLKMPPNVIVKGICTDPSKINYKDEKDYT